MESNPYGQSYAAPQEAPAPPPPAATAPPQARTRIGLVALTAVLLEFLFIAAGDNQWVADKMLRDGNASLSTRILEASWLTYSWRFSRGVRPTAEWGGQLLLVGTTLAVTAALVFVLLRGPVSWARAFFGTWLAVVFASLVGAFVRGLVAPDPSFLLPHTGRLMRSVYGSTGPSTRVVVASVALGLIVALVTSIVAVATRRSSDTAAAGTGAPAFPDYAPPPAAQQSAPPPWQDRVDQPTMQQPRPSEPATPPPPPREAPPSSPPGQFPRPPDDEDLGHVGH